jgi:acetyl esterase/lipase
MKSVVRALLLALALAQPAVAGAQDIEIARDVVYGHKDGMALTFDVLRPEQGNGAGVMYMVSGGWVSSYSPPEQMAERFAGLLDRGFTLFIVRHGSSPKYLIPEIVGDVRRAVSYIKYNAEEWDVDPERLGAFGGSAGGHLSLMLGTAPSEGDPPSAEEFMRGDNRIASVVAYYPPVDLRTWARGLNAPPPANGQPQRFPALNFERELAPDYSPIVHLTSDDPPTLLIHGDADELVPITHSERMYAALQEKGVRSEYIVLPGAGHGFRGEDATRATAAMIDWFVQTLDP